MTTNTDPAAVEIDPSLVAHYKQLTDQIAELEDTRKEVREQLEAKLGDSEVGTINGVTRVRWTTVTSSRLDQKKAKAALTSLGVLDQVMVESTSRRFVIVDGE